MTNNDVKRVRESFEKVKKDIGDLRTKIISEDRINILIREALDRKRLKVQSEPNSEPNHEPINHYEELVIKRAKKTRPEIIKQAIRGLIERDMRTTDIFKVIVSEKKLCGKTQLYHYLSIVRTEYRTELRTKVRTEPTGNKENGI